MFYFFKFFGLSVGGLFSTEYATAPWSVAKVLDMIEHLWVVIIVIGTGGTAGIIRVMRGTLLDELGKQYVITARSKGVSELRLLFRYPVRVAINPIISTVGWLLPTIVSGAAITAVVLSLPTTGVLLLGALVSQDMYLAGSIIMVLSSLTVAPATIHLLGTDELGRDMLTRVLYASRISLSVGLGGVLISFLLGCLLGGVSGFYSGKVDTIIQRVIELLRSIPTIPLWMGLAAALPAHWSAIKVYFGITLVLSIVGWTGLARVVRGKLLELREEDFVTAARVAGARERSIISRHLLPSFSSYLIVNITLDIPGMILGETALSFLGLGLRPPVVSWGVLLKAAQNVRTVAQQPWLLVPALFVIVAVLAFNFLGDGMRDAADPYK